MVSEARKRLESVRYHLSNLQAAQGGSEVAIRSELSALQNASYSVAQRVLFDASKAFGLNFTPEDRLNIQIFRSKAKEQNKDKAVDFADWWSKETESLSSNPVYALRGMDTHRGDTRPSIKYQLLCTFPD